MDKKNYLTISEFARISEISRKALIFYDKIGVFSPKHTAPNGYRYYTHEQIYVISVVNILKELGMPLSQIKEYTNHISPERAASLLREQTAHLQDKIGELTAIQDMLSTKLAKLEQGISIDTGSVQIRRFEEEPIFISDPFHADRTCIPDDIWLDFYVKCKKRHVSFGYPEGYLVTEDNLTRQQTGQVSNIIAYVKDRRYANNALPAGDYVTVCGKGGLEDAAAIYSRLFDFIKETHCPATGPSYEERLIDEVGSADRSGQIIRIRIRVRE